MTYEELSLHADAFNFHIYVHVLHSDLFRFFSIFSFRSRLKMEVLTRQNSVAVSFKPNLTFSIDKIIGTTPNKDKEASEGKRPQDHSVNKLANIKDAINEKGTENDDGEKSGFKPVKRSKLDKPSVGEEHFDKEQYQTFATEILKSELNRRQMYPYLGREVCDVNMNMSYLHPAFMFGRITAEGYQHQVLQNLQFLHTANVPKDLFYTQDHFKVSNELRTYPSPSKPANITDCAVKENEIFSHDKTENQNVIKQDENRIDPDEPKTLSNTNSPEKKQNYEDTGLSPNSKKVVPKNQKSFACPECGKLFNAHYNLTRHMPVHTGKKCF